MKILRVVLLLGLIAILIFFGFRSSSPEVQTTEIRIEAEDANDIRLPMERRTSRDGRVTSLYIPPRDQIALGQPMSRHATFDCDLSYSFTIEEAGDYYLWSRVYWSHICANSFHVTINGGRERLIGNDEVFHTWHWVRHKHSIPLTPGSHRIEIDSFECDIQIDCFLLSTNKYPQGVSEKGFIDDFRGDLSWSFRHPERWSLGDGIHLERQEQGHPLEWIVRDSGITSGFHMTVQCEASFGVDSSDLSVLFGFSDRLNYWRASFDHNGLGLDQVSDGEVREHPVALNLDRWIAARGQRHHKIDIRVEANRWICWINGQRVGSATLPSVEAASVGVASQSGAITLDSIAVAPVAPPRYRDSFHITQIPNAEFVGLRPKTGSWQRGEFNNSPSTLSVEAWSDTEVALSVFGKEDWVHCRFSAAVWVSQHASAGLVLRYQDDSNYWGVRVRPVLDSVELFERRGGLETTHATSTVSIPFEEWVNLQLDVTEKGLKAQIGGQDVLAYPDFEPGPGFLGLYSQCYGATRRQSRPIALYPNPSNSVEICLTLGPERQGSDIIFDYQDNENYSFLGLRHEPRGPAVVLGRTIEGRPTIAERRVLAYQGSGPTDLTKIKLPISVKLTDDIVRGFLRKNLLFEVSWPDRRPGRVGTYLHMPSPHAQFDDLMVGDAGEQEPELRAVRYDFRPPDHAAKDLAAWKVIDGEWSIDIAGSSLSHYNLVGRTESSGTARMSLRKPLVGDLQELRFRMRPLLDGGSCRFRVEIGEVDDPDSVSFEVELFLEQDGTHRVQLSLIQNGLVSTAEVGRWGLKEFELGGHTRLGFDILSFWITRSDSGWSAKCNGNEVLRAPSTGGQRGQVASISLVGPPQSRVALASIELKF